MQALISIIRQPPALIAILSEAFSKPQEDAPDDSPEAMIRRMAAPPTLVQQPLEEISSAVFQRRQLLLTAWNHLGGVQKLDAHTLFDILVVLIETVACEPVSKNFLPPLSMVKHERQRPKRTAAHPRAFHGTTYQPPKERTMLPMDLRPHLDDSGARSRLLSLLDSHRPTALRMLKDARYDTGNLGALLPDCDPYCVIHHHTTSEISYDTLPARFRSHLLPQLKGLHWSDVVQFVSVYWSLQLAVAPDLLFAVSRLLALRNDPRALGWLSLAVLQPVKRRVPFISALIETKACALGPTVLTAGDLDVLNAAIPDERYGPYMCCFFAGLPQGVPVDYLLSGIGLAAEEIPHLYNPINYLYRIRTICSNGSFPDKQVDNLMEHIRPSDHYFPTLALSVWEACGKLEGLGQLITRINWECLQPDTAFKYLEFYTRLGGYEGAELTEEKVKRKWRFVRDQAPLMEALIATVPSDYREKVVKHLSSFYWYWDDPEELKRYMPLIYSYLRRVSKFPFKKSCDTTGTIANFLEHTDGAMRTRMLSAPDGSFLHLERACLRENNARLVEDGIESLSEGLPEFTVECFLHFPAKLFRTVKVLGSLPPTVRRSVVHTFCARPIMTCDVAALTAAEATACASSLCTSRISSPVPRSLQDHVSGKRSLSDRQIERALGEMSKLLYLSRLEALEEECLTTLEKPWGVSARDESVRHALQLSFSTEENRRTLRKFLKAHWRGSHDYLLAHPLTRRWIEQHPGLKTAQWMEGIRLEKVIEPLGSIRIEVEKDPLEALKLGTYAGSCLGLGGGLNYSAAAVVLDVNKQVLYARNEKNHVVARQVVALSEAEQLVCFSVYPASAPDALQQMFREHNILFSAALGVERYTPEEQDYTIKNILSSVWWDDHPWQHEGDDAPRSGVEFLQ